MEDKSLKKLERIIEFFEKDHLSAEDFQKSLEVIIQFVLDLKKVNEEKLAIISDEIKEIFMLFKNKTTENLEIEKSKITKLLISLKEEINKNHEEYSHKVCEMNKKIDCTKEEMKKEMEEIEEKMLEKIPEEKEIKAEEIRDLLEKLKNEDRLDKSAIKGLEEIIKEFEEKISKIPRSNSGGGFRQTQYISEEPTGIIDGVNDTFYLSATPKEASLFLMWQGQGQRPTATTEYILTGKKIIFNAGSIPTTGALWANYSKF